MQAHLLVTVRCIASYRVESLVDEFLNKLGARGSIFDQYHRCLVPHRLLSDGALEARIVQTVSHYVQEIDLLFGHSPGRTHAEITEFARLIRGIPAIYNLVELLRQIFWSVTLEPLFLYH